jgi:hypothetical protein
MRVKLLANFSRRSNPHSPDGLPWPHEDSLHNDLRHGELWLDE